MVDTRVLAVDIPRQEAITKDNVPVSINGALFFKVTNVEDAVMKIQDYVYGISLLAQTALRDVVGGMVLDDICTDIMSIAYGDADDLSTEEAASADVIHASNESSQLFWRWPCALRREVLPPAPCRP